MESAVIGSCASPSKADECDRLYHRLYTMSFLTASIFVTLLLLVSPPASSFARAAQWDRDMPYPHSRYGGNFYGARVPILEEYFWLDTMQNSSSNTTNTGYRNDCNRNSNSNSSTSSTPWLLLGWYDALVIPNVHTLFGMVWPPSYTQSQRPQFLPLPLLRTVPQNPGPSSAAEASSRFFAGHLFMTASTWAASLWTLHVPSATWRPLGPSRMANSYLCDQNLPYNVSWQTDPVFGRSSYPPTGTVDDYWFSDISMAQVDEFGCPWPASRIDPGFQIVNDTIYLFMGALSSEDPTGDVWRLRMDANLRAHYDYQAASHDGRYVYNSDQLKYLHNSQDPSINRDRLCPVKWELLTAGGYSSKLNANAADAASPTRRNQMAAVVVNSSAILISGGLGILPDGSPLVLSDIWLLQLEPVLQWVLVSDRISPPTYSAGQTPFLARRKHTLGIMSVRIADYLPNAVSTSFQLPLHLEPCVNETTRAILLSNGLSGPYDIKASYIESPWLLIPSCDVVWQNENAINRRCADGTASSVDGSLYFYDDSFQSIHNWTAVPLPLQPLANSFTGVVQGAQYHFLPNDQQLLAVGGNVYGQSDAVPPRIYDFRARTRHEVPMDFSVEQEITKVVQDRPMMMKASYPQMLGRWMYMFGGLSVFGTEQNNEMWRFHVDTYEWQLVGKRQFGPNATQETRDTPTVSASGALWPRWAIEPVIFSEIRQGTPRYIYRWGGNEYLWPQEYVYPYHITYGFTPCQGGFYRFDLLSNTWENITDVARSTTRWTQSDAAAAVSAGYVRDGFIYPRPRCTASNIVLGDSVYVFGGTNGFPYELTQTTVFSNDLWKLNLTTLEWTMLWPGNLSLSNALDALQTPNSQPVTDQSILFNFPLPDGSGFSQCFSQYMPSLAASYMNICQSYNIMTNTWTWHTFMPGSPVIWSGHAVAISNGRVLVVSDDYSNDVNSVFILNVLTWSWEQLPPSSSTFPPANAQYREAASMVYVEDQNRVLMWGGELTALNNSYITDLAVHSFNLDDLYAGQMESSLTSGSSNNNGMTSSVLAHDWLAVLPLAGTPITFSSGRRIQSRHFATLAGALYQYQFQLASGSCKITILDRIDDKSLRTRRTAAYAIGTIPITANVTLRGDIDDLSVGVLECASTAHAGMSSCFLNFTMDRSAPHAHSLQNLLLRNFHSDVDGGALLVVSSSITLENVSIESSSSGVSGGAVWMNDVTLDWNGGRVENASAQLSGGAIYLVNSLLSINDVSFYGNGVNLSASIQAFQHTRDVYGYGGAISAIASTLVLSNDTFSSNYARVGGAIAISGLSALFPHTDISLGLRTSSLEVSDSVFSQNEASELGGGLFLNYIYSAVDAADDFLTPTVQRTLFDGNSAGARGGAIYVDDSLLVANQTEFRSNECGDAGGAIFWQPGTADTDWSNNQPILLPGGIPEVGGIAVNVAAENSVMTTAESSVLTTARACVSRVSGTAWLSAGATSVPVPRLSDSVCNIASYGPFIATGSANLALTKEGRMASDILQTSGAVVSPAIRLQILDAYEQVVTTENSLYVSAFPVSYFAGESIVRASAGELVFENLILKAAPNRTTLVTFTPGSTLVRYVNDIMAGSTRTTMELTTSRVLYVGLQSVSNSTSFTQVATCAALCSLDLPLPQNTGAVSTLVSVTFNVSMFASSASNILTVSYGSGAMFGSVSYAGADIATAAVSENTQLTSLASWSSRSTNSGAVTLELEVPSVSIRLTLQTGDDRVGYVSGLYFFSKSCPDLYALDVNSGQCLETRSSSLGAQIAIIVLSAVAELIVLIMLLAVVVFRDSAPIRATSPAFNIVVLVLLMLLPIAGIVFAVPPSASSDSICHARCWLGSLPVIGILSVLFAKAARVAAALSSQSLKASSPRVIETRMWSFVAAVMIAQIALCLVFTLVPISRSELRAQTLGSDSSSSSSKQYLIRQCVLDSSTFPSWFGAQLSLLGVLALGASYVSFLTRDASSMYNESFHNSNALFMLVLTAMIVIPLAFLVHDSPDPILLLQGGAAAFLTIVWCAALFLPKLMQVYRSGVKREKQRQIILPLQMHVEGGKEAPANVVDVLTSPSQYGSETGTVSRVVRFHHHGRVGAAAAPRVSPSPLVLDKVNGSRSPQSPATDPSEDAGDIEEVMVSLSPDLHTFVSNPSEMERQMQTELGNSIFQAVEQNDASKQGSIPATGDSGKAAHTSGSAGTASWQQSAAAADADNEQDSGLPQLSEFDVAISRIPPSQHPASHFAHPMETPPPLLSGRFNIPQIGGLHNRNSSGQPELLTPVSKPSLPANPSTPSPASGHDVGTPTPGMHTTSASDPETVPPGCLEGSEHFNSAIST